jgi:ribosomal protein S27AE
MAHETENKQARTNPMPRTAKQRYCFNCGEDIGFYADYDPRDTCGKQECDREARNAFAEEREEAHERLDRDMGW